MSRREEERRPPTKWRGGPQTCAVTKGSAQPLFGQSVDKTGWGGLWVSARRFPPPPTAPLGGTSVRRGVGGVGCRRRGPGGGGGDALDEGRREAPGHLLHLLNAGEGPHNHRPLGGGNNLRAKKGAHNLYIAVYLTPFPPREIGRSQLSEYGDGGQFLMRANR